MVKPTVIWESDRRHGREVKIKRPKKSIRPKIGARNFFGRAKSGLRLMAFSLSFETCARKKKKHKNERRLVANDAQ